MCSSDLETLTINDGVLDALDKPETIQLLINEDEKMMGLRACTVDDLNAIIIQKSEFSEQPEIGGRSLLRRIQKVCGWSYDGIRVCTGEICTGEQGIRFNLSNAIPM